MHVTSNHIFRPRQKQLQSLKKIQVKLYEEFRSQDTQCLYTLVENDKVQNANNVTQFNLRITAKCHAYLETKHMLSFKKIEVKL